METNFKDLKNIYNYLEANAIDYSSSDQIGSIFQKLRDLKLEEDKKEEAFKAQWETDFFNFGIHQGSLEPLFGAADKDGNEFTYPNLENFTEEQYEYLIERLNETKNPFIQARYSIILWHSPKKHGKYAKIAVDSLFELVKLYEEKDKTEPGEHWGYKAFEFIENAYYIGFNAKYRINDIKLEIMRLIKGFNHKSGSSLVLRLRLIELMLEEKKVFTKNDFHGFQKVCWELSSDLISKKDFHGAIMILKIGERVDNKTGIKTYIWRKRIAKAYESLMEDASQKENLASIDFCLSAINNYKKINDKAKITELKEKYENLNQNIELGQFSVTLKNYNKHLKEMEEFADNLTDKDSEVLIEFLMSGYTFLLPKFEKMEEIANDISKNSPLLAMCSKINLDSRGHPSKHYTSEEEREYHQIIQNYKLFIEVSKPFLYSFFTNAIYKKKLSPQIILEYFRDKTWLGTVYENKVYNKTVKHDWIALLAPSIFEYFRQIEIFFLNPINNSCNFTLCTDSLVLKLEGIIRDFCALNGIKTFEIFSKKEKSIVQEKSLNKLLNEEKLEEILGKDDLLFLKILLVEQSGYNLRNEVAHSLLSSNNYDFSKIHLLLLALFRLAKYVNNDKSP
ncbi:MAG: DUF4209 domain-containing protein [Methanobacterium formicicum]